VKSKKRPEPVMIKAMRFDEVLKEAEEKQREKIKYFNETGLCCSCKKEKAYLAEHPDIKKLPVGISDGLMCQKCNNEIEELLKQLRGPGFMEIKF
jgi:hypothetical protein